jgi:serine/threonine protein phosphatase PrpC
VDLSSGDYRFLIIACDGLWDVISNQKAIEIVDKYVEPGKSAAALRDYAHLMGSADNISVIVFKFDLERKEYNNITRPSTSTSSSSNSNITAPEKDHFELLLPEKILPEKDNIHISPERLLLPTEPSPITNLNINPNV